jgi:hypothetical protein
VIRYLTIFALGLTVAGPLMAAPPPLPQFVQTYFDAANLTYELPQGRFGAYLTSVFEAENQAEPWAVVADVNGDDIDDWAGLLRDSDGQRNLVCVYSVSGGYAHTILREIGLDSEGIGVGVELVVAGDVEGFPFDNEDPDPTVSLDYPGVHLMYYEKSSVLYYWKDGAFQKFWTSD